MRLDLQLGVELFCRAGFLGIDLFFPRLVAAEADFLAPQRPAVEPDGCLGQPLEEGSVVADNDKCALVAVEPAFEPVDCGEVEVVGWLVHQQQVRVLCQRAGDGCAAFLATACAACGRAHVDTKLARDGFDLVLGRRMVASKRKVHQRVVAGKIRFLFQHHDTQARLDLAFALVGFDPVIDQAEQCCLARTIAADQRQPVTRLDMEVEIIVIGTAEQPLSTLLQGDAFKAEDGRLRHSRWQLGVGGAGRKTNQHPFALSSSKGWFEHSREPSATQRLG